jgi:hypothetical protein
MWNVILVYFINFWVDPMTHYNSNLHPYSLMSSMRHHPTTPGTLSCRLLPAVGLRLLSSHGLSSHGLRASSARALTSLLLLVIPPATVFLPTITAAVTVITVFTAAAR